MIPMLRVRYQLAFTLGEIQHPDRLDALAQADQRRISISRGCGPRCCRRSQRARATCSASSSAAGGVQRFGSRGRRSSRDLVRVIGSRNKGRELLAVLNFLDGVKDQQVVVLPMLGAFADGLRRADVPLALFQTRLQPILDQRPVRSGSDRGQTGVRPRGLDSTRVQAIELLGLAASTDRDQDDAAVADRDGTAGRRAVRGHRARLAGSTDPSVASELLKRWPRLTPVMRRQVLNVLLAGPDRAMALVKAVRGGDGPAQRADADADRVPDGPPEPDVRVAAGAVFTRADQGIAVPCSSAIRLRSISGAAACVARRRTGAVCDVSRSGRRRHRDRTRRWRR